MCGHAASAASVSTIHISFSPRRIENLRPLLLKLFGSHASVKLALPRQHQQKKGTEQTEGCQLLTGVHQRA